MEQDIKSGIYPINWKDLDKSFKQKADRTKAPYFISERRIDHNKSTDHEENVHTRGAELGDVKACFAKSRP